MRLSRRRKCRHCQELFRPDPRNQAKQKYCSKSDCRKASKTASQRKWQAKPENKTYFHGPENVQRVQEWRKRNPGYWRKSAIRQEPLQDHSTGITTEKQGDNARLIENVLQDLFSGQPAVFVGLLAHLSGSSLQDDIVHTGRRLQQLGQDILTEPLTCKGGHHDSKQKPHPSTHDPPGTRPVQLD